jgi:integrase
MANVRKTKSGKWKGEYRDAGGHKISQVRPTKREALQWASGQEVAIRRGDHVDPNRGRRRFSDFAEDWFDSAQHLSPSTRARYEIVLRRNLLPVFGTYPLAGIDHEAVQKFVNDLVASGYAPASVRKAFNVLSVIMRTAVSANRIAKSPCVDIRLPRLEPKEMRFLDALQLRTLAEAVAPRFQALVYTGGYLGLRWSELAGLRLTDISLLHRRLSVMRGLVEVGGRFYLGSPKSPNSTRTISLPEFVADRLDHHIQSFPSTDGLVFSGVGGGPIRKSWIPRHFKPAVARAGLQPFRWHDLRHTSASLAISVGAHPKVIQVRLGHSSIQVTLDTYGHLFDNIDAALAADLDRLASDALRDISPPVRRPLTALRGGEGS